MYRSYSYHNMPQPIIRREEAPPQKTVKSSPASPPPPPASSSEKCGQSVVKTRQNSDGIGGILKNLQSDDIILMAVILALLVDGCDDKLLLIALGFVFFSDLL